MTATTSSPAATGAAHTVTGAGHTAAEAGRTAAETGHSATGAGHTAAGGNGQPPLLLVGHGTRSAEGAAEFGRFVARVRQRAQGLTVDGGFIELAGPSVGEVVARMHGAGTALVAVPLVLTAAGHGKGDIPASLAREAQRHPGRSFAYGRPLGPHPVLQHLLACRIDAALAASAPASSEPADHAPASSAPASHGPADPGDEVRRDTTVVLVGRGSTDPDANAEVAKVARLLWEGRGYGAVEYGFVSLAGPSVPAALERARRLGGHRIVVAPYFLFPGVLPDRVAAQAREFAAGHPELAVSVAGVLGDCDELAGLVLERYAEALRGDIRMNCDTCAYRVALPGFAHKVGLPQTPHHHPHEADGHGTDGHAPRAEAIREVAR